MTAAPIRHLLFGGLLLVCAWVPAATLAAPHSDTARAVEVPAAEKVHTTKDVQQVAATGCPEHLQSQQS